MVKQIGVCYNLVYLWDVIREELSAKWPEHYVCFDAKAAVANHVYEIQPGGGCVTAQNPADDTLFSEFNAYLRNVYPASVQPSCAETVQKKTPVPPPVQLSKDDERGQELQSRVISSTSFQGDFFGHAQRFNQEGKGFEGVVYTAYLYRHAFWTIAVEVSCGDAEKLIDKAIVKDEQRVRAFLSEPVAPNGYHRERIPEQVRNEVWRRDQGRCVHCGSRERLEFDHIVPLSLGGSNTARNIELLCETCNRRKGAAVAL